MPTREDPSPVVEARGLRFAYPGEASVIDIQHICIAAGEHTAIMGPSGCGKTTLLHLLAGILTPDAGSISISGHDVTGASLRERRRLRLWTIGMMFQSFALLDAISAIDNITLPERLRTGHVSREIRDRARTLGAGLGLSTRQLARQPHRLSQGERQRVAIARAIFTRPAVLMCDEPTGNLDRARAAATMDLLFATARECGATLLVVTHDAALLDRFDRVLDLDAHRVGVVAEPAP